ncbi:hypothetical protein SELMODRAFT_423947 [Selaginella moellendorffii]|uniref:S1 motif domain-containing protein n=1 Tax=Selaginella moellendorffii TaxID=88036 RepID=D8SNB2_SELML|nr:hypothetical protein SELMODRAFT_423947 [Selaginella moellendorffii]
MDRPHKRQDCILQRSDPWAYAFIELERSQRGAGTHGPLPLDEALVPETKLVLRHHSSRCPKLCYLDKAADIGRLRSCDAVEVQQELQASIVQWKLLQGLASTFSSSQHLLLPKDAAAVTRRRIPLASWDTGLNKTSPKWSTARITYYLSARNLDQFSCIVVDEHGFTLSTIADAELFSGIEQAPLVVPGRKFPVEIHYELRENSTTLRQEDQQLVFEAAPPGTGKITGKIVFATNIAETSLTMPGIRLYSNEDFDDMALLGTSEISRSHMGIVVLKLLALGVQDVENFDFVEPPSASAISHAMTSLQRLEAIAKDDEVKNWRLTNFGLKLAKIGVEPWLGTLLWSRKQTSSSSHTRSRIESRMNELMHAASGGGNCHDNRGETEALASAGISNARDSDRVCRNGERDSGAWIVHERVAMQTPRSWLTTSCSFSSTSAVKASTSFLERHLRQSRKVVWGSYVTCKVSQRSQSGVFISGFTDLDLDPEKVKQELSHGSQEAALSGKKMTKVIVLHGKAVGERSANKFEVEVIDAFRGLSARAWIRNDHDAAARALASLPIPDLRLPIYKTEFWGSVLVSIPVYTLLTADSDKEMKKCG